MAAATGCPNWSTTVTVMTAVLAACAVPAVAMSAEVASAAAARVAPARGRRVFTRLLEGEGGDGRRPGRKYAKESLRSWTIASVARSVPAQLSGQLQPKHWLGRLPDSVSPWAWTGSVA